MSNLIDIQKDDYTYSQYSDYVFKNTVQKYANGVLDFLNIPYRIHNVISSEYTNFGPKIHRLDFVGEVRKGDDNIILILECQSKLPTDDDIMRFFQYVSTLRVFKNRSVELYILCIKKAPYTKKEFVINDECIYTMNVISLKHFKACKILKNIENKIKNNEKVSDKDIASLQLIVYTDYAESRFEILKKAQSLVEKLNIDINEKIAIIYILEVLSANMLEEDEKEKFMEERDMNINPRDEYLTRKGMKKGMEDGIKKGKLETAKNLLNDGMSLDKVCKMTGLTKTQIQEAK